MPFDYQKTQHHIQHRNAFPTALKADCLDEAFSDWQSHPGYAAHASALHGFHNRLRQACQTLSRELEHEAAVFDDSEIINWRLLSYGQQIISVAHSHHEAEDSVYFPRYIKQYSQLARPLALLDGDHKVLDSALNDMEADLMAIKRLSNKSQWQKASEQAHMLSRIIHRHLDDEEEIVMPVLVRRAG